MIKPLPSKARLRRFFYYSDGVLVWRERPRTDFKTQRAFAIWNARFAKKPAGRLCRNEYRMVKIDDIPYLAHRLIWVWHRGRLPKKLEVDHIDSNKTNNRIQNLRLATRSQNIANTPKHSNNTSGFKGVRARHGKWVAQIVVNGKNHHLGTYTDITVAAAIYAFASELAHGEFTHPSVEMENPFRQLQLFQPSKKKCLEVSE